MAPSPDIAADGRNHGRVVSRLALSEAACERYLVGDRTTGVQLVLRRLMVVHVASTRARAHSAHRATRHAYVEAVVYGTSVSSLLDCVARACASSTTRSHRKFVAFVAPARNAYPERAGLGGFRVVKEQRRELTELRRREGATVDGRRSVCANLSRRGEHDVVYGATIALIAAFFVVADDDDLPSRTGQVMLADLRRSLEHLHATLSSWIAPSDTSLQTWIEDALKAEIDTASYALRATDYATRVMALVHCDTKRSFRRCVVYVRDCTWPVERAFAACEGCGDGEGEEAEEAWEEEREHGSMCDWLEERVADEPRRAACLTPSSDVSCRKRRRIDTSHEMSQLG